MSRSNMQHLPPSLKQDPSLPCRILELPAELRLLIYDYALNTPANFCLEIRRLNRRERFQQLLQQLPQRIPQQLALLEVNRQIRKEASPVFYERKMAMGTARDLNARLKVAPHKAMWLAEVDLPYTTPATVTLVAKKTTSGSRTWRLGPGTELDSDRGWQFAPPLRAARRRLKEITSELDHEEAFQHGPDCQHCFERGLNALKRYLEVFASVEELADRNGAVALKLLAQRNLGIEWAEAHPVKPFESLRTPWI